MNGAPRASARLLMTGTVAAICGSGVAITQALRPLDLIENPIRHLGRAVEVEVVEPIRGPSTPAELARAEYGKLELRIPDGGGAEISLVPAEFALGDAGRYRRKFDRVLASPLRVRGEFLRDEETSSIRRPTYVIRVLSAEPLDLGPPLPLASLADLAAAPARWDRKLVVYEGTYRSGFEISKLDREIWLEAGSSSAVLGGPAAGGIGGRRVRVTGVLFARPGARYGHLGCCKYLLAATKIEDLARP